MHPMNHAFYAQKQVSEQKPHTLHLSVGLQPLGPTEQNACQG